MIKNLLCAKTFIIFTFVSQGYTYNDQYNKNTIDSYNGHTVTCFTDFSNRPTRLLYSMAPQSSLSDEGSARWQQKQRHQEYSSLMRYSLSLTRPFFAVKIRRTFWPAQCNLPRHTYIYNGCTSYTFCSRNIRGAKGAME